jgi:hypothetical protein
MNPYELLHRSAQILLLNLTGRIFLLQLNVCSFVLHEKHFIKGFHTCLHCASKIYSIIQTKACIGFAGILKFCGNISAMLQTQCLQHLIIEDL